jgi:hypothetical protein
MLCTKGPGSPNIERTPRDVRDRYESLDLIVRFSKYIVNVRLASYEVARGEAVEQKTVQQGSEKKSRVYSQYLLLKRENNTEPIKLHPPRYQETHLALQSTCHPTFVLPAISFPAPASVAAFVVAPPGS